LLAVFCLAFLAVRGDNFADEELDFPSPGPKEEANPPYATVQGLKMPSFTDATLCFRLKTSVTDGRVSIFSYAVESADNEFSVEINLKKNTLFFFKNDQEFGINLKKSDYKNNEWIQMCLIWDNHKSEPKLMVGNPETGKVVLLPKTEVNGNVVDDTEVLGGGTIVIGQDQDVVGGGFQAKDGMKGLIGNVQLFGRKLTKQEAAAQMKCKAPEGDLLAWSKADFKAVNSVSVGPATATCESEAEVVEVEEVTETEVTVEV